MSIATVIETDLGKVAHVFVTGASKLKAAIHWAASQEQKIAPEVAAVENVANALADQIYPGAGTVAAAIEAGMEKLFVAVDSTDAAMQANLVNIGLDQAAINSLKAALPIVKAQAATVPGA